MPTIAVLEDDPRRITALRAACRSDFPDFELRAFVSAREMIAWLSSGQPDIRLISLDRDLDVTVLTDAACGSGEEVTAYLARNPPNCPVLIHSTNAMRAPAMHMELVTAGCPRVVLCPFQDAESWAADVRGEIGEE